MIKFTDALHNHLVDVVESRIRLNEAKGKKAILIQQEIFLGACSAIDFLNGQIGIENGKACITPVVYFSIMAGDRIEKIKEVIEG